MNRVRLAVLALATGTAVGLVWLAPGAGEVATERRVLHGAGAHGTVHGTFRVTSCVAHGLVTPHHCGGVFVAGDRREHVETYASLVEGRTYRAAWRQGARHAYVYGHPAWRNPLRLLVPSLMVLLFGVPLGWLGAVRLRRA